MSRLRLRVAADSAAVVTALAIAAAAVAGVPAALGLLAGGALALGSFWRLAGDVERATAAATAGGARLSWLAGTAGRLLLLGAAAAALLATGWVHPAALVVGLTIVPGAIVVQGLRLARLTEDA